MRIAFWRPLMAICILCLFSAQSIARGEARKVFLISIDGLRPEFYLSNAFETPTLKKLVHEGAFARSMTPVFPTVTYPNHTSLVTGVPPGQHQVLSNTLFHWDSGPSEAWFWETSLIKVETLWSRAKKAGLKTASVRWPVTVGAEMDWLVPEIFPKAPWYVGTGWELTVKLTKPAMMDALLSEAGLKPFQNDKEADEWAAKATRFIMQKHKPNLMLLHLIETDHQQHATGRDSAETREAVSFIDGQVKEVVDALDPSTCVLIVGDHGFFDYSKTVNLNRLFVDKGWIQVDRSGQMLSWTVIAQKSGAQAAIYSKDPRLEVEITATLKANEKAGYALISRAELRKLGAYPEAVAAVEANEGYTLGGSLTADLVTAVDKVQGQHGYHPKHPKMHTGFIASGCGITPRQELTDVSNLDIAPTVSRLLGMSTDGMQGRAIALHLAKRE